MDDLRRDSSKTVGEIPDVGTLLAAYTCMLEEWHRSGPRAMGDDYRTVLLVLLGAEGYIAYISSLTNWLAVLVVAGISTFAILLQRHEDAIRTTNVKISTDVAEVVLDLERRLQVAGVFDKGFMDRIWFEHAQTYRVPSPSLNIHRLFTATFIVIPVVLALATLLMAIPATHPFIHPLVSK